MRKVALVVVVLALAGVACGGDEDPALESTDAPAAETADTSTPAAGSPAGTAGTNTAGLQGTVNDEGTETFTTEDFELELELDNFYFKPTFIKAPGGSTATVKLHNEGEAPHTFTIDALEVDETLQPGDEKTVEVELGTESVVAFYCKFHKGQGMQGAFQLH